MTTKKPAPKKKLPTQAEINRDIDRAYEVGMRSGQIVADAAQRKRAEDADIAGFGEALSHPDLRPWDRFSLSVERNGHLGTITVSAQLLRTIMNRVSETGPA